MHNHSVSEKDRNCMPGKGSPLPLIEAIKNLVAGVAHEYRSSDDSFALEISSHILTCYVRGQQGGWCVSPIPVRETWVWLR